MLAAKTGYEPDMIEMDMALETELGVDSIKRVEILSDVQKELNVEAQDVAALSRTQTVGEVVEAMIKELGSAPAVSANAFSVMPTPSTPQSMKVAEPAVPSMALKNKDFDQARPPSAAPAPPLAPRPSPPAPPPSRPPALPPSPSRPPALPPAPFLTPSTPFHRSSRRRSARLRTRWRRRTPTAARRRRCSRSATRSSPSSRSR